MKIKFSPFCLSFYFWLLMLGILAIASLAQEIKETQKGNNEKIIEWWSFDQDTGRDAFDEIAHRKASVFGNFTYVPGVKGKAIKLDGFRTYVTRKIDLSSNPEGAFTVESWVALATYPWSWAPVIDCTYPEGAGFFFGLDQGGHVRFKIAAGHAWYEATSMAKIPLNQWTYVAASFEPDNKIKVFINGQKVAEEKVKGNYIPVRGGFLTVGRNNYPQTWDEYQLKTENTYFYLDGLLDEIKIISGAKSEEELKDEFAQLKKLPVPALSDRSKLPRGPVGSGSFGAFQTKLNYYKEWDDLWRVSEVPDIFVRFEDSPVQLVFWRGTSYVPCWVTENDIWYTNEWLETWGADVKSCAEPLMDRQCRYSRVSIIENTDARVVIHWRYALVDAFYNFVGVSDDNNGEWCDEFYTVYPDMIGIRKMELHYSKPERKHDWEEQIVILPPGKYPDEVIENEAITLINMKGDIHRYSWHDPDLKVEMNEPKGANMSLVNLKSKYRPFIILSPDPVKTVEGTWDSPFFRTYAAKMASGYRPDPVPSVYGWWNHWPVAMIPGDGRWVITPDRPSHFNLTTYVQWKDYEHTDRTRTRIMLHGMTDKKAEELVPIARSWLYPPTLKINTDGYLGGNYDQSERAYIIDKAKKDYSGPLFLTLEASDNFPAINPAIIIRNWGKQSATISINDKNIAEGKDLRLGIRKGIFGNDLIIWIKMDINKNVKIKVE